MDSKKKADLGGKNSNGNPGPNLSLLKTSTFHLEMVQFLLKLLLKQIILAVHHDFH